MQTLFDLLSAPPQESHVVIPPWLYQMITEYAEMDGVTFDEWCDKNLGRRFGKPRIFENTPIQETEP